MADANVAKRKKILPKKESAPPAPKSGCTMIMPAPIRLIHVPISVFVLGFSCRKKIPPMIRKIGVVEAIIGKLILGARLSPR